MSTARITTQGSTGYQSETKFYDNSILETYVKISPKKKRRRILLKKQKDVTPQPARNDSNIKALA